MSRHPLVPLAVLALTSLAVPIGCGLPEEVEASVGLEDQAAAAQALLDDGDTLEDAPGEAEEAPDDEAAIDEAIPSLDCGLSALRRRVVERYDTDGDGALSPAERAELESDVEGRPLGQRLIERHRYARRAVLHRLRFVYDVDGSGQLDEAERAELRADMEARCAARQAQLLTRYDADGSGALEEEERAAFASDMRARRAERRSELLARFDADGDGSLSDAERAAMREEARARAADRRAQLRARFDVNGNGQLEDEERDALRAFLRARIRLEDGGEQDNGG